MDPISLLLAFGPPLLKMVPQLIKIISPAPTEVASRNQQLAQIAIDTIVKTTETPNLQAAVEKMQTQPEIVPDVQKAVVTAPGLMEIMEVGGGIAKAREANLAVMTAPGNSWWSQILTPVFLMSIALCAMLIMVLGNVLGMPWGGSFQEWSENTRSNVVFAVITGAIGAITGYWFGTTVSSNKKDQVIAAQSGISTTPS